MSSSQSELFDVFSFETETRRLRQTSLSAPRTPFSHVRVSYQQASDEDQDEDEADMEEEDRDERGSTENHDSDQDLGDPDEKMTDVADTLANMLSHPTQSYPNPVLATPI